MRSFAARALLIAVVASSTGCCTAFNAFCDCVSCLLNGPRLPGLKAQPGLEGGDPAPAPRAQSEAVRY